MRYFGGGVGHRTASFMHIPMVVASELHLPGFVEEFHPEPGDDIILDDDTENHEDFLDWFPGQDLEELDNDNDGSLLLPTATLCK